MFEIIPKPLSLVQTKGEFIFNTNSTVFCSKELEGSDLLLTKIFSNAIAFTIVPANNRKASIQFLYDNSILPEGYKIEVTSEKLYIYASTKAGALYAIETLRQILRIDTKKDERTLNLPCITVEDHPRYGWRSLLLDESRHFFGIEEVKRLLDFMAMLKLNVFHWHLTDDAGWRIEIKKYPLLTEIGSKRANTQINGWGSKDTTGEPHSGFYTQTQIKEIVAYASNLQIMVVPEIDMPAHCRAAFAAYPYLACREIQMPVPEYFSGNFDKSFDWHRIACAGKDTTYQFIYDIIDELALLFPAPYFHIGGDEAPKFEWKKCPLCQKTIKDNNLKNEEDLQGYFNNKISAYLKRKNKSMIGWNEILATKGLDKSTIIQYWTLERDKNVEEFARSGGKVVISKHQAFYFDMGYAQVPLRKTYKFEPDNIGIKGDAQKNVLGLEGALWTEWIAEREKIDFNLFPRLCALSEVAWSAKEARNYKDFKIRFDLYKPTLDALGINYAENKLVDPYGYKRKYEVKKWYSCDQYREVRRNRELKLKK